MNAIVMKNPFSLLIFFDNLICLWSLNYKSLKTLNISCIQDIDFGLNQFLECKLGNKLHVS